MSTLLNGAHSLKLRGFRSKWGGNQAQGSPGDLVSYSFATQNYLGQFNDFDSFITLDFS